MKYRGRTKTDFEELCDEYRFYKRKQEENDDELARLKKQILAIMGNREEYTEGAAKAIYRTYEKVYIDWRRLKEDLPDVLEEYADIREYHQFFVR